MQMLQEVLGQVISDIWISLLSMHIEELPTDAVMDPPAAIVGCVQLIGTVSGGVAIQCGQPLARRAAASMFNLNVDDVTEEDIRDAVGELANVAAGNLKAVLPSHYQLSMPAVVTGSDFQAQLLNGQVVAYNAFASEVGTFSVSVFEEELAPRRKR